MLYADYYSICFVCQTRTDIRIRIRRIVIRIRVRHATIRIRVVVATKNHTAFEERHLVLQKYLFSKYFRRAYARFWLFSKTGTKRFTLCRFAPVSRFTQLRRQP